MKRNVMTSALAGILLLGISDAHAQSLLGKISKGIDTATKVAETAGNVSNAASQANDAAEKSIDWSKIPVFTTQSVIVTGDDGQPLLNEDGTPQRRVFLVDQFGQRRSKESVKAQQKAVRNACLKITGKIGGGAALGVLGGLASGKSTTDVIVSGASGVASGVIASAEDIKIAKAQLKSLKEQNKLLEAYQKTFTDEGIPVDAKANLTNVDGIDFTKGEEVSMASADVIKELESEAFNTTDTSAWDF